MYIRLIWPQERLALEKGRKTRPRRFTFHGMIAWLINMLSKTLTEIFWSQWTSWTTSPPRCGVTSKESGKWWVFGLELWGGIESNFQSLDWPPPFPSHSFLQHPSVLWGEGGLSVAGRGWALKVIPVVVQSIETSQSQACKTSSSNTFEATCNIHKHTKCPKWAMSCSVHFYTQIKKKGIATEWSTINYTRHRKGQHISKNLEKYMNS